MARKLRGKHACICIITDRIFIHMTKIEVAKKFMESRPEGDMWANGFAGVDTTYMTKGYSSIHGGSTMRTLKFLGALLAFEAMSRNNLFDPFCTTSCSMEVRMSLCIHFTFAFTQLSPSSPSVTSHHYFHHCQPQVLGVEKMCPRLKVMGFGRTTVKIAIDGDVKLQTAIKKEYPKMLPRACSGI